MSWSTSRMPVLASLALALAGPAAAEPNCAEPPLPRRDEVSLAAAAVVRDGSAQLDDAEKLLGDAGWTPYEQAGFFWELGFELMNRPETAPIGAGAVGRAYALVAEVCPKESEAVGRTLQGAAEAARAVGEEGPAGALYRAYAEHVRAREGPDAAKAALAESHSLALGASAGAAKNTSRRQRELAAKLETSGLPGVELALVQANLAGALERDRAAPDAIELAWRRAALTAERINAARPIQGPIRLGLTRHLLGRNRTADALEAAEHAVALFDMPGPVDRSVLGTLDAAVEAARRANQPDRADAFAARAVQWIESGPGTADPAWQRWVLERARIAMDRGRHAQSDAFLGIVRQASPPGTTDWDLGVVGRIAAMRHGGVTPESVKLPSDDWKSQPDPAPLSASWSTPTGETISVVLLPTTLPMFPHADDPEGLRRDARAVYRKLPDAAIDVVQAAGRNAIRLKGDEGPALVLPNPYVQVLVTVNADDNTLAAGRLEAIRRAISLPTGFSTIGPAKPASP